MPTVQAPAFYNKQLRVVSLQPVKAATPTIYPFDYCGIYNKERFTLTGGFDYLLTGAYWQKLDFGFRAYMWGEQIVCDTAFRVSYHGEAPVENTTREQSYKLFYLKNLAIRFSRDFGTLPRSRLLPYLFNSGGDFFTSLREFFKVRNWVEVNKYRFRQDARSVTELWESPE